MSSFLDRFRRKTLPPSIDAFDGRMDRIEGLVGELLSRTEFTIADFKSTQTAPCAEDIIPSRAGAEPNIIRIIERLVKKTDDKGNPNINQLWALIKDIDLIKLNIKTMGYQLARDLADVLPKYEETSACYVGLSSRATRQEEFDKQWFAHWCHELNIPVIYHRKLWEYVFVLQSLHDYGLLNKGKRGVGFGCGQEPLPSYFASLGMIITVTDLHPELVEGLGWAETGQHSSALEAMYVPDIVPREDFEACVDLRYVDMNNIPDDLSGYDFCWSICALEHLGSIDKGLDFIENSLTCLKPGGVALHTTEFNYLDDQETIDNWMTVLFQRKHFEAIAARLSQKGHIVAPLNFDVGDGPMDSFIDLPPYEWMKGPVERPHLKLSVDGFASTCFGMAIKKAG